MPYVIYDRTTHRIPEELKDRFYSDAKAAQDELNNWSRKWAMRNDNSTPTPEVLAEDPSVNFGIIDEKIYKQRIHKNSDV